MYQNHTIRMAWLSKRAFLRLRRSPKRVKAAVEQVPGLVEPLIGVGHRFVHGRSLMGENAAAQKFITPAVKDNLFNRNAHYP